MIQRRVRGPCPQACSPLALPGSQSAAARQAGPHPAGLQTPCPARLDEATGTGGPVPVLYQGLFALASRRDLAPLRACASTLGRLKCGPCTEAARARACSIARSPAAAGECVCLSTALEWERTEDGPRKAAVNRRTPDASRPRSRTEQRRMPQRTPAQGVRHPRQRCSEKPLGGFA